MKQRRFLPLMLAIGLLASLPALAENSTTAGGFTIHHNAFTTSILNPDVAKAYGIQRSKFRGMLNLSVIKHEEGTTGRSVPARVNVQTLKLTGQSARLPMREIKEQDAVYYVGELAVKNEEKVNFVMEVTPQGTTETFVIKMDQQFFTD